MRSGRPRGAFTLVEILIVVVLLGVLAAMVVPQFAHATEEAGEVATKDQLNKLRQAVAIFHLQNGAVYPVVPGGSDEWGDLEAEGLIREPPQNNWVGGDDRDVVILRETPDEAFQNAYGWIYNQATGEVWAAGFDGNDNPYPKP